MRDNLTEFAHSHVSFSNPPRRSLQLLQIDFPSAYSVFPSVTLKAKFHESEFIDIKNSKSETMPLNPIKTIFNLWIFYWWKNTGTNKLCEIFRSDVFSGFRAECLFLMVKTFKFDFQQNDLASFVQLVIAHSILAMKLNVSKVFNFNIFKGNSLPSNVTVNKISFVH